MPDIHPQAIVDSGTELGKNVTVSPFSIIESDVIIGSNTWIGSNVFVASGTQIGENCEIHHGAVLGTAPQDVKYKSEKTKLEIGDNTIVREYSTINRGTRHSWKTQVGSNCFIMTYAHIAHDCKIGDHVILANAVNMGGHVQIDEFAGVGGIVPIHQFVRIGKHTFIGGGYRVPKDVPPFVLAMGDPLRFAGVNRVGLTRQNMSRETINKILKAYKIFYRSNLNVTQALNSIKDEFEINGEIKEIVDFVESSERGVMK